MSKMENKTNDKINLFLTLLTDGLKEQMLNRLFSIQENQYKDIQEGLLEKEYKISNRVFLIAKNIINGLKYELDIFPTYSKTIQFQYYYTTNILDKDNNTYEKYIEFEIFESKINYLIANIYPSDTINKTKFVKEDSFLIDNLSNKTLKEIIEKINYILDEF